MSTQRFREYPGYFPFGSQYYRAPTPYPTEWAKDMRSFAAAGFNNIKIWAQWRWNAPEPGVFDFSDLKQIMDLAHEQGIKVTINTIFDVGPVWLNDWDEDVRMVTADGRKLGPWVSPCRQVGGWPGPCINHPQAQHRRREFLVELAKQLGTHPALNVWDLWNEPELSGGTAREGRWQDQLCYCDHCREQFIDWLEVRYGDIAGLNAVWNRNYRTLQDVELPVIPSVFNDMIDWRMFHVEMMTAELQLRADSVRQVDNDHPVMCHIVPMPIFNAIHAGSDDWRLAEPCDWFGNSLGSDPFAADMVMSAANGRPAINAEIHALPGTSLSRPRPIDLSDVKRHLLIPLSRGIKGFLFWQYRPELLGTESPAWGLTKPDGSPSPWLQHVALVNNGLQAKGELLWNMQPSGESVGILFNPENHIFSWCAEGGFSLHDESLRGCYDALAKAGYRVRFIHSDELKKGQLSDVKALVYPFPYVLDNKMAAVLTEWVEQGGTLIGEAFFGNLRREDGLHSQVVPGYGLDELFGANEGVPVPFSASANVYSGDRGVDNRAGGPQMELLKSVGALAEGDTAEGFLVAIPLELHGATPLAQFPTGETAVSLNRYGKGQAILVGSLLTRASRQNPASAALVTALVQLSGVQPIMPVSPTGVVRADLLQHDGQYALVLQNLTSLPQTVSVQTPGGLALTEFISGDVSSPDAVSLEPSAVELYWLT